MPINPKPPVTIIFFITFFFTTIVILSILHSHMQFTSNNLTFVIVTFNSRKVIHDCLNSLPKDFHKLIIENSSDAELKKELEQNYFNTKVILSTNIGMGAGNNIGIANSKTKFVYVLNPDVKLSKDTDILRHEPMSRVKKFIVDKGSISINGVSLTISKVSTNSFQITIIPHTLKLTNLVKLRIFFLDTQVKPKCECKRLSSPTS